MFRKLILIIFCISAGFPVIAQEEEEGEEGPRIGSSILNDTTEHIYGPETTEYFYYEDILNNTGDSITIDTTVFDLHRFNYVDSHNKRYQNLGVVGTAIRPVFYQLPDFTGLTTGFNVYDLYIDDASDIKFYDTRSPYSRLGVVIGGEGRSITSVSFARNIDERSNFGFNYRGMLIDKQFERERRGDRNVESIYYNIHGNYRTRNGKYQALGAFIRNNHVVDEYGGIRDTSPETPLHLFFEDTVKVTLANTEARDLRRQYFFYHEYRLTPLIEVFHEYQHKDQIIGLKSNSASDPDGRILPDPVVSEGEIEIYGGSSGDEVADWNVFEEWSNKIGLAGNVGPGFYKVYYQRRKLHFDYRFMSDSLTDTLRLMPSLQRENTAGATIKIGTEEEMQIVGRADYTEGGYYNIFGRIGLKPFYGSLQQMKRKPSYIETAYRSMLNEWYLIPLAPVTSELKAGVLLNLNKLQLDAGIRAQRLTNYIYFINEGNRGSRAVQNTGTITALMPRVSFSKWWGNHWLTKGEAIYSMVGGDNPGAYPLPDLFTNLQISFHSINFEGNLEWQAGFDIHWKSAYYAPGYDPLIQQFVVQDQFLVPDAPVVDVFVNAKINRGRLFLKYTNLFYTLTGQGYFPTPYYPGQVSTFDFGFNWSFYD